MDLSYGCSSGCRGTHYRPCRGTHCGILTVLPYVESCIVRDDRVETQAAVDLVNHPVGRSDGVVPIAAEDLLRSSRKVHCCLRVYGVGAVLTVHLVLAPLAAQTVVLEIFASGSAAGGAVTPGLIEKERPPVPSHQIYDPFVLGATPRLQLVSPKIPSSDSPAQLRR
jgi:hypothetical protein